MTGGKLCVGLIGVGLVGGALLRQISGSVFKDKVVVVALASSKKMLLSSTSTPLTPASDLTGSPTGLDLSLFSGHLLHSVKESGGLAVIVDCTATGALGKHYPAWMGQGISVVTPNKKAFSGDLALFQQVLLLLLHSSSSFFFILLYSSPLGGHF